MRNLTTCERVVQAVAAETNSDPLELPPLYGALDTDALDTLVDTAAGPEVSFQYAGCTVAIDGSGTVEVDERPGVAGACEGGVSRVARADE